MAAGAHLDDPHLQALLRPPGIKLKWQAMTAGAHLDIAHLQREAGPGHAVAVQHV